MKAVLKMLVAALAVCALGSCSKSDSPEKKDGVVSMRFEQPTYTLAPNGTVQPRIFVTFENSPEPVAYDNALNPLGVTWSSSDKTMATVSAQGVVTCLKYGVSTITAQTAHFATPITTRIVSIDPQRALWWGEWTLTSWNGDGTLANKVYMALKEDGTFELYQNITTPGYAGYKGTYTVAESNGGHVLSGIYSDNVVWTQTYDLTAAVDNLSITGRNDKVVSFYQLATIPDYVKDGVTAEATRAANGKRFL